MINDKRTFFSIRNDEWFVGNDGARGPWSADACHAGPVTGLIVRALEQSLTDKQLVRITTDYARPIPMSGFRIDAKVTRSGRAAATGSATLTDAAGKVCATATSLHLVKADFGKLPTTVVQGPSRKDATPGRFAVENAHHDLPFFRDSIEVAYPPGESNAPGPTTLWMRTPPLLDNETPSPFQSICPLADCGNGTSRNAELTDMTFVNPDLTIVLHRLPESEWLASSAVSFWEPTGIGLSRATLFDEKGPVGSALQTLLIQPID
ncbi:MAG: thioesterase family protein [Gammaproteobacteria bacterium]|nr:thioesterase family protein [Gammaproteobacteria bacterium]MBU2677078.1 thioesterase family protein [Gammaproteobacteria bacterium]NNC57074.1 thioesterase family protein [Woeseiaceae bacterium]NNL50809.1 thioesterase family protein [Woeseiaceae bacterium]